MDWIVVLAAGRGTRAGGPKALHVVRAQAWWRLQSRRLAHVGLPVAWVVSAPVREAMRAADDAPRTVVIADDGAPMFASVAAGCAAASAAGARGVFVLPIDVPAPSGAVFTALLGRNDSLANVPVVNSVRGHPIYLTQRGVQRVLASADDPGARLDTLIGAERTEVPVSDPAVLVNLNTSADFAAWESEG